MISRDPNNRMNRTLRRHHYRRLLVENLEQRSMFASDFSVDFFAMRNDSFAERIGDSRYYETSAHLKNDRYDFGHDRLDERFNSLALASDSHKSQQQLESLRFGFESRPTPVAGSGRFQDVLDNQDSRGVQFSRFPNQSSVESQPKVSAELGVNYRADSQQDSPTATFSTEYIFISFLTPSGPPTEALQSSQDGGRGASSSLVSRSFRDRLAVPDNFERGEVLSNVAFHLNNFAENYAIIEVNEDLVERLSEPQQNTSTNVPGGVVANQLRSVGSENISSAAISSSQTEELYSLLGNLQNDQDRVEQLKVLDGVFEELETGQNRSNDSQLFKEQSTRQQLSYDGSTQSPSDRTPTEDGLIVLDTTQRMVPKTQLPTLDSSSRLAWSQRIAVGEIAQANLSRSVTNRLRSKQESISHDESTEDQQLSAPQRAIAITVASVLGLNWLQRKRRARRQTNMVND